MSSSALTNLVPVLNGENSVLWFQQMTAYLMSTGEWDIIEDYVELTVVDVFYHVVDVPAVMSPGGQHVATAATTQTRNDLCLATNDSYLRLSEDYVEHLKSTAEWKAKDSKVRGHILLRCSTAIQKKIKNEDCAFDMWKVLQGDYAVVGTSGIYNVFLKFLHIRIPAKGNPVQAIDKMEDHVRELEELNVTIPKFLHGMLLLSKLPPYMKFVAQLAQTNSVDEISPDDIKVRALNAYQAEFGAPRQEASNRVTAVHRNRGTPQFRNQRGGHRQQQQRQQQPSSSNDSDARGDNNHHGRVRRRGRGRGRGRGGNQGAREATESSHFLASMARIDMSPPRELEPEDSTPPYSLKSVRAGPLHKASPSTFHPTMGAASRLADRIGVKGTPEALRILERVASVLPSATIEEVESDEEGPWLFVEGALVMTKGIYQCVNKHD